MYCSRLGGGSNTTTITNCQFIDNVAGDGSSGSAGALAVMYGCMADITNCVFIGNTARNGAAIRSIAGDFTLNNCTFSENDAGNKGGTLYLNDDSGNNPGTAIFDNCILWDNSAVSDGNEIYIQNSHVTIQYCDIQDGNGSAVYNDGGTLSWGSGIWPGTGNIDKNPRFINAMNGNFRLQSGSPCIDSGNNATVIESTDIDGLPRFIDDPTTADTGNGTAPIVDMGAYEYECKYQLVWFASSGGGGTSSGGDYSAMITIGQAEVDAGVSDTYEIYAGFWPGGPVFRVDLEDFAKFAFNWDLDNCNLDNNWCNGADLNESGDVKMDDLMEVCSLWLQSQPFRWPLR